MICWLCGYTTAKNMYILANMSAPAGTRTRVESSGSFQDVRYPIGAYIIQNVFLLLVLNVDKNIRSEPGNSGQVYHCNL